MSTTRALAICVLLGAMLVAAAPGQASPVTLPDRESSYPPGVANVSHAPWTPRTDQDVVVTMRLTDDARVPDAVSLLYCRVEPEYVCGLPLFMDPSRDQRTWRGSIVSDFEDPDGFMQEDTVHVGYNVTMRFQDDNGSIERVSAPTGNFWVPASYPEESDGVYYFLAYGEGEAHAMPGPAAALTALLLVGVVGVVRAVRGMRRGA